MGLIIPNFLLIIIVTTLAQAANVAETGDIVPLDYWDEAESIWSRMVAIVDQAEITANKENRVLDKGVVTYSNTVLTTSHENMESVGQRYLSQITNLDLLAGALGTPHCLDYRYDEFKDVFRVFLEDVEMCIHRITYHATDIIRVSAQMFITNARTVIGLFRGRLDECTREKGDQECIVVLIGELEVAVERIPTSILDELLRVMLMAKDWEEAIDRCANDQIGIIYAAGNRVITEIESCLLDPHHNIDTN